MEREQSRIPLASANLTAAAAAAYSLQCSRGFQNVSRKNSKSEARIPPLNGLTRIQMKTTQAHRGRGICSIVKAKEEHHSPWLSVKRSILEGSRTGRRTWDDLLQFPPWVTWGSQEVTARKTGASCHCRAKTKHAYTTTLTLKSRKKDVKKNQAKPTDLLLVCF